jgi:hypothetical protein
MKAYGIYVRKWVVKCFNNGAAKVETARRSGLGRHAVHRYLAATQTGTLTRTYPAPKSIPMPHSRNSKNLWRQPSRGLGAFAQLGFTLKNS